MQEVHVSYEELEKYMDETDLSEPYLCWSERITEHLKNCMYCRRRLDRMFLVSELCKAGNVAAAIRLAGKEEELKREIDVLRLECAKEDYEADLDG